MLDITVPSTPEAKEWASWNTQLKPAVEPIVVARKPLEGTVAANVLKYGTGAMNIDACRVPTEGDVQQLGRYPANLVHDGSPEVLACFPSSGKAGSPVVNSTRACEPSSDTRYTEKGSTNFAMKPGLRRPAADSPARFFYCAKASRSERGEGNDHLTVKPIALMRWLVKLVTRKGGVVLDPFMGSGTTGIAALAEGCRFVGIEKDPDYFDIAKARVNGKPILPPDDNADSNPPSDSETISDGLPSSNPPSTSTPFVQDSLPL